MDFIYTEQPEYQFPHWIEGSQPQISDDFNHIMNINEWCGSMFGDLGVRWGYFRQTLDNHVVHNPNPVRARLSTRTVHYSWRFKDRQDAMTFKLRWHNA